MCLVKSGVSRVMWQVGPGVQRWVSENSHMRCGIVVWGRMCGNMDMGESLDPGFDVYNIGCQGLV